MRKRHTYKTLCPSYMQQTTIMDIKFQLIHNMENEKNLFI